MTKLICFDMDGVIFKDINFWMELHKIFETLEEGEILTEKYLHTDYDKLVEEVVNKLWKGRDSRAYYRLVESLEYLPGVKETFEEIKKNDVITAIISGSSIDVARRAQRDLGIDHIYANELIIKDGKINIGDVLFSENKKLINWLDKAHSMITFQGLPARICWLPYGDREKAGLLFNRLVRDKKVKAPIVIGRDHLDSGSVASPNRETEAMRDGSDAVSDWPLLNLMINTMNGASWASFHHGGGVGMGYSQHAGMVIVCDGTEQMDKRLSRVLNSDSGMGIVRHADAGYEIALEARKKTNIKFPSLS